MFFAPEKLNEVKAVKVAVLAAPGNVSAAQRGMPAAPSGVLALQDTHRKFRGA